MKGCISFSLYGDAARYSFGMLENCELAEKIYPEWEVLIFVERGHYFLWGITRTYSNRVANLTSGKFGNGWFIRELPELVDVSVSEDQSTLCLIGSIYEALWFDCGDRSSSRIKTANHKLADH